MSSLSSTLTTLLQANSPAAITAELQQIQNQQAIQAAVATITEALPSVNSAQITAFLQFVAAGNGLTQVDAPCQQLWTATLAGDTGSFIPALILLAASVFKIKPQLCQIPCPDVSGLTQAAATIDIAGSGLILGSVSTAASQSSPPATTGTVISQNPAAGTSVQFQTAVNIVIAA